MTTTTPTHLPPTASTAQEERSVSGIAWDCDDVAALYRRHLATGRATLAEITGNVVETSSEGTKVYGADGREFLDCGGYGVFLLGHRHPRVVRAVIDQIGTNPLATRLLLEPTAAVAARELAAVAPPGLDRVHFVNSGAEAVEAAIKLARANGRTTLVSADNGYHGKTMGALSLTARDLYQRPFRPLLPDVHHVPYGDAEAIDRVLVRHPGAGCVVLEPVQGEGGVVVPPPGYLAAVADICREHGALFVLDEVQTGLGRLGTWWGADRDGVSPDILLVGKNLSGGVVPVAAMLATTEVYAPFSRDPFLHTSTFAASPLAMAAAAATVRVIREEGLVDRARRLGEELLSGVQGIARAHPEGPITDVRGAGLLIGIQLRDPADAGDLVLELLQRRVLVNHSLNAHDVLRLTPSALLDDADVEWLLEALAAAVQAVAPPHPAAVPLPLERTP
jgi:putrescine aminotransferase